MAQLRKPRGQPTRIAYWYAAAVIGILLVFFLVAFRQAEEEETTQPELPRPTVSVTMVVPPNVFEFYVDGTGGDDQNDGFTPETAFKTIQMAQSVVEQAIAKATVKKDVHVYLAGDLFQPETLSFSKRHSGTEEQRVLYSPFPKNEDRPHIHGGIKVGGWRIKNKEKRVWGAPAPHGVSNARQIYVNGLRATRTSIDREQMFKNKLKQTSTGYETTEVAAASWSRPETVELVYTGSGSPWTEGRCGVQELKKKDNSVEIVMRQPCYRHASTRVHNQGVKQPRSIENLYDLLGQPGRFYFDTTERIIYYTPRVDEYMITAEVIVPATETLMEAVGLEYVSFTGITFEYAGWLRPSGDDGFPDIQAGCHFLGNPDMDSWVESPANIIFSRSKHITFDSCVFQHLGVTGLSFVEGCQHITISSNLFTDISCSALQMSQVTDSAKKESKNFNGHSLISGNFIHTVAVEYRGCVGLLGGYLINTTISHNELADLPYTAISLGWGWDAKVSYASDNSIIGNRIQRVVTVLADGGGIYTLGPQPRSHVKENFIRNVTHLYAGIYHDEGSAYFETSDNVILDTQEWLRLNMGSAHDLSIHDCFTNQPNYHSSAKNSNIHKTVILKNGEPWPERAKEIQHKAGPGRSAR